MVKLLFDRDYTLTDKNQLPQQSLFLQPQKIRKSKGFFLGANSFSESNENDQSDTETMEIQTTNNLPWGNQENSRNSIFLSNSLHMPMALSHTPPTLPLFSGGTGVSLVSPSNSNTFSIKSNIDINATDALGRTCIHHLVQPFSDGSYTNNIELLELLHQSGALLTKVDQNGLSPLEYCVNNGCQHLYEKLLELINGEKTNSIIKCFPINDPNKHLLGLPDYYSDAQQFIDEYILTHSSKNLPTTFQVDPISNMSQTGEVLIDTEKNEPYDVRLTITDVDYGLIGLYNFYRMQIIKHKSKTNLYLLFTRWGRIGDGDGQHQLTPYSSFDECRAEFCKIFREKTGNLWEKTNQFETKPKKYTLIQLNERQFQRYINVPIDFQRLQDDTQHPPSKLQSSPYKIFFKTLLNPEAMQINLQRSQLDVEWMPVSQLKPSILQKARDILVQLKNHIQEKDKLKLTIQQSICIEPEENQDSDIRKNQFKHLLNSICKLTNEYYSIIPLQGYGDERLPMIDNEMNVKAQEQKLDDILELELSYKMLLAAQANLNQISPLDYLYKSINCQFEAMNRNDIDSELILRYIWTSTPNSQVEQIFKVFRSNDDEHLFQRNLKNHYLLWHGTNVCNLISILTRGNNQFFS